MRFASLGRADGKRHGGGTDRVLRGGSWNNNAETNLRSSNRNNDTPSNRNDNNGFRCVLEYPKKNCQCLAIIFTPPAIT